MIPYSITNTNAGSTLIAFDQVTGKMYLAQHNHPNYNMIVEALDSGDESVWEMFAVVDSLAKTLQRLSDRVSYDPNKKQVLWDGDTHPDVIARHLERMISSGATKDSWMPLVKFWEKISQNPDARSREQLFKWLESHDFSITTEGDIVGYKGVSGNRRSIHSGYAVVDGVEVNGYVPNEDGSVISMPRSKVKNDPSQACSYGLHVGDFSYANNFGSIVLEVHVNPMFVVSIPYDSQERKMRCCEYKVIRQVTDKYDSPLVNASTCSPRIGE